MSSSSAHSPQQAAFASQIRIDFGRPCRAPPSRHRGHGRGHLRTGHGGRAIPQLVLVGRDQHFDWVFRPRCGASSNHTSSKTRRDQRTLSQSGSPLPAFHFGLPEPLVPCLHRPYFRFRPRPHAETLLFIAPIVTLLLLAVTSKHLSADIRSSGLLHSCIHTLAW